MAAHLLPSNATGLERDLSLAMARLEAVPVPIPELWNSERCPADLLPLLAWSLSVDYWSGDWTEEQKREVIRRNWFVHAHKGTRSAIDAALGGLDQEVRITEWWQELPAGEPYTFRADVMVSGVGIDGATEERVLRIIEETKNVRSHLAQLRVIGAVQGDLRPGVAALTGDVTTVYPYALAEQQAAGPAYFGPMVVAYDLVTVYPRVMV